MWSIALSIWALVFSAAGRAGETVDYARDVKPIFQQHCRQCHGPDKCESGLRLDTPEGALTGGYSGPAIIRGKSGDSLLIKAVTGAEDATAMPPERAPLAAEEIALVRRWIDEGAPVPTDDGSASTPSTGVPGTRHWSFQPLVRPAVPVVRHAVWVRNPIDAFVAARLEADGIEPSPEADHITLLRRLTLDLIGELPGIAEVDDFLLDNSPAAFDRVVDRLLASPHYGERWGRHWLDQARYADSNGYTIDGPRSIWKYRDWVIDALNRDLPFDQFIIEQLAGDLLDSPTTEQLVATGFHRNTLKNEEGGTDPEQFRVEAVVDRVSTTAEVFLGLTLGCARCHDHKYDPLSQRDFYQMFAFFNSADEPELELPTPEELRRREEFSARIAAAQQKLAEHEIVLLAAQPSWEAELTDEARAQFQPEIRAILAVSAAERDEKQQAALAKEQRQSDLEWRGLRAAMAELKKSRPQPVTTLIVRERPQPRTTHIMLRGDFLRPGAVVAPGVPAVLPSLEALDRAPNRLDLAHWLVDRRNPLTARVAVNRVWQRYFGRGLVEIDNDFGTQGTQPTHPELLDWLASEFMESGWSLKRLHHLVIDSATYRQSSQARPELLQLDPENKLLARQNRLRLEAESIRDIALAAGGLLSPKIGGPSVFPPQPAGVMELAQVKRDWIISPGEDRYRRGMYTYFWRSSPYPFLKLFDAPEANTACTRRMRSNTPLQALTLLNDAAFFECAQALAVRVLAEAPPRSEERLRHALRLCLAREPTAFEAARLSELVTAEMAAAEAESSAGVVDQLSEAVKAKLPSAVAPAELAAWTSLARVLLNLDEFISRE